MRRAQQALIEGQVTTADLPATLRGMTREGDATRTRKATYQPDPIRPYAHPYYWAPFVLMGNWF